MGIEENDKNKLISILICTRGRRQLVENLAGNLLKMETRHTCEIIVVEETDHPVPIPGIRYSHHPVADMGIAYARNLALGQAEGDIVVFLDDDCMIHDNWMDNLVAPFGDGAVIGVQGGVTVPENTNAIGWVETLLGFPGGGLKRVMMSRGKNRETREVSTLNCAYRKSVLDEIGGFDENLKFGGEDYLLAKQACNYGKCLFIPGAMVNHRARSNIKSIWFWFIRRGRAEISIIRTGKTSMTYFSLLKSSITVKLVILFVFISNFKQFAASILIIYFSAYVLIHYVRFYKIWKMSKQAVPLLLLISIIKFIMDLASDYGRVIGVIFGKSPYRHIKL